MPWNEPGSGNKDPWGSSRNKRGSELDDVIENVRRKFGGSGGFSPLLIGGVILAMIWSFQSLYIVEEGHESIELRFGKHKETVGAGLQMILWPIEQKIIVNSQNIRTLEVGFRKDTSTRRGPVPSEAQMLTTDENIADVSLAVQYNIANVENLLFEVNEVELAGTLDRVVRGATESALREVVGSTTMDDLFNIGRGVVESRTLTLLQDILNRYKTGINVVAVEMQAAVPPAEVREAFDNVNKADQVEQQLIKESKAYEEKVVLEAEGQAARLVAEATGYKEAVIARAEGEGQQFTLVLSEYQKAPDVTRTRLYIETMEEVFANTNKVIIDQEGGNNMMYLPLDQIMRRAETRSASSDNNAQSQNSSTSATTRNNNRGGR